MKIRTLKKITKEEIELLVKECFDGELVRVIRRSDKGMKLEIRTNGWDLQDPTNPKGSIVDHVEFRVGIVDPFNGLVEVPFSRHNEERIWQEFMIYHGIHPLYKNNRFGEMNEGEEE